MQISKAIEIKLQWRKDRYQPPSADETTADMMSIEALKYYLKVRKGPYHNQIPLLPGEDPDEP